MRICHQTQIYIRFPVQWLTGNQSTLKPLTFNLLHCTCIDITIQRQGQNKTNMASMSSVFQLKSQIHEDHILFSMFTR